MTCEYLARTQRRIARARNANDAQGHSAAFYLETICVVLLLVLVLGVVVQFFGQAHTASARAENESNAVTTARTCAELFQSSATPAALAQSLGGTYNRADKTIDATCAFAGTNALDVHIVLSTHAHTTGALHRASITISDPDASGTLYQMDTARYVEGGTR